MVSLYLTTKICAPRERCFDLSRSIDLHLKSVELPMEKAIAGVTTGLISSGEEVTWQARHLGLTLTHTSRITDYRAPVYFQDSMVRGAFRSFCHDHYFAHHEGITTMYDAVNFAAPLGILGKLAEKVILEGYMRGLLERRNSVIKRAAEGEEWRTFLG